MQALHRPPLPLLFGQVATDHLLSTSCLKEQHRRQGKRNPPFDFTESLEAIVVETETRFELFEKQLNLPSNLVQIDDLTKTQVLRIGHQDFDIVGSRFGQVFLCCRIHKLNTPYGMNIPSFFVGVVNTRFHFRSDTPS